jgi:hypothetical protein
MASALESRTGVLFRIEIIIRLRWLHLHGLSCLLARTAESDKELRAKWWAYKPDPIMVLFLPD